VRFWSFNVANIDKLAIKTSSGNRRGLDRKIVKFAVQDVGPSFKVPSDSWDLPDDLAGITIVLAGAASDFVTGTAIPIDGGYSIAG
jgi:NAD(P)-dependent dehydrogenase (short-subunit alcohol dehydrogenase family)